MAPSRSLDPRSHRTLPWRFWIIALIVFINAVSFTILIPILYPYAKEFGLNDFQASLLTTVYALAQFIATPILGRCSDAWGRKPLLVISLLGTVLSNLIASFTGVAWVLFTARILDGITGGNNSIAGAVLSDTTSPEERPRAFGMFDAAFRLGFLTGPAISYFAQKLPPFPGVTPLGMSFFAAATIALMATLLTLFCLPETLKTPRPLELGGQLFNLAAWGRSLRQPTIAQIISLTFFSGFTFTIFTFAMQPFFMNVLHQKAENIAILISLVGISGVLTQVVAMGPLTQRFNSATLLLLALVMRGLIFLAMPILPSLLIFTGLTVLLGIINAFPLPLINASLSVQTTESNQGEVMGLSASALSIANALGPAIAGALVGLNYHIPFYVAGALTLITAIFGFQIRSTLGHKLA